MICCVINFPSMPYRINKFLIIFYAFLDAPISSSSYDNKTKVYCSPYRGATPNPTFLEAISYFRSSFDWSCTFNNLFILGLVKYSPIFSISTGIKIDSMFSRSAMDDFSTIFLVSFELFYTYPIF